MKPGRYDSNRQLFRFMEWEDRDLAKLCSPIKKTDTSRSNVDLEVSLVQPVRAFLIEPTVGHKDSWMSFHPPLATGTAASVPEIMIVHEAFLQAASP